MVHKCRTWDLGLRTEIKLENHKKVHVRGSKVYEYGSPELVTGMYSTKAIDRYILLLQRYNSSSFKLDKLKN